MADPPASTSGASSGDLTRRLLAGRYRLVARIAAGGMAEVWEATDERLTRQVAVKILHPHLAADDSFVRRFRAEAIAAARLTHPSIVSVYDTFRDDGVEAIVMELVHGTTLRAHLDAHGPLAVPEALAVGVQVADALAEAHRAGLVHRDVKPGNILLSVDGRVLVADFGIAKATEEADVTSDGMMVGTAKYLAPEQVEGKPVDARTDVYALGVVLYESLCGRPPFVGDSDTATAMLRLHTPPLRPRQMRAGIPKPVEEVVLRAMARAPEQRYPDALSLRSALIAAGADPNASAAATPVDLPRDEHRADPPEDPPAPPSPSFVQSERTWLVPAVLVVLVAVALGVTGVLLGRTDAGRRLIDRVRGKTPAAASSGPIRLAQASAFDPFGGDGEHDDRAPLAIDGNPATQWATETYKDPVHIGGKPGVGLVVRLASPARVDQVIVSSPSTGWSASVYTADGAAPAALDGWGPPRTTHAGAGSGDTTFDLGGVHASAVLVWFTRMGDDGRVAVGEVAVRGR